MARESRGCLAESIMGARGLCLPLQGQRFTARKFHSIPPVRRGGMIHVETSLFRQYARSYWFFVDSLIRSLASSDKVSPKDPPPAPTVAARRIAVSRIRRSCRLYLAQNLQMRRWRRTPIRFPRGRERSIDSERSLVTSLQESIRTPSRQLHRTSGFPGTAARAPLRGGGSPRDWSPRRPEPYRSPRCRAPRFPGA